jgi:hypothetical protein
MPDKKPNSSYRQKRRKFLRILGLSSAVAAGQSVLGQVRPERNPQRLSEKMAERPIQEISKLPDFRYVAVKLLRPYDLLSLELRYYNFTITDNKIVKRSDPAYLVVLFQPQTISEEAGTEEANNLLTPPSIPAKMLIGGESRLAFKIPASISNISFDVNEMLDWEKYELLVNERARQKLTRKVAPVINRRINEMQRNLKDTRINRKIQGIRGISKDERLMINNILIPENLNSRADAIINIRDNIRTLANDPIGPLGELETSLEVPLRIYLSPTKLAGWKHLKKTDPDKGIIKETNKLFELWHTRMGTKTSNGIDETDFTIEQRIVRALWADDANKDYKVLPSNGDDNVLGKTSFTSRDRHQIVHESSNFQIPQFVPQPVKAYKLFLTTLGAWLDSELLVDFKKLQAAGIQGSLNLLKWRHIETLGREHYVEIVNAGYVMPLGHEAVSVKITERKPHGGTGTATNFQRIIVVITEPVKEYNYHDGSGVFMNFCCSKVELITTVTPILDTPQKFVPSSHSSMSDKDQFIIRSSNKDFLFKIKAEDLDGNLIDFSMPLVFVSTVALGVSLNTPQLITEYNKGIKITNDTNFNGQKFALATKAENGTDTAYTTYGVSFKAKQYTNANEPQGFLPILDQATIIEPSYQRLTGNADPVSVSLVDDKNDGNVFAKFNANKKIDFSGQTDKTGGLAAPNFNLTGLSKAAGAFGGDIAKFKSKSASATDFFNPGFNLPEPKLFGVFKLSDILDFAIDGSDPYSLDLPLAQRVNPRIPNLVTENTPDAFITSYVIKPNFNITGLNTAFAGLIPKNLKDSFSITTLVKAYKKNPTAPEFSTDAWLKNFSVGIVKLGSEYLVTINFKQIRFTATAGKKADVSVDMEDECLTFGGPLSFINEITKLIDPKGFSDPPYLDVSPFGIKCGYTLALPNLQMGAFTLSNLSLGAEVNLPFSGGPLTFGFRFCERQQPFTLTISCLGGGGFFGLELDLNGIRQIEAALEFGAAVSLNFGVASGSVSVMAGIYFKMEFKNNQNDTTLTGYVRINGAVSVLGLITASIELYLALTYKSDIGKAYGEASLEINIEILFFSTSVTIHTQKTFAGSGDDPNFKMSLTQGDWQEYCGAFAA